MGSVSILISHSSSHFETSAQTDYSPIAPPAAPPALDQDTSENAVDNGTNGDKGNTNRISSKTRFSLAAHLLLAQFALVQFFGDDDEKKLSEWRPLLPLVNGGRASEVPLSCCWTLTAIVVASVACVMLYFWL
jgi:hypothetical protein